MTRPIDTDGRATVAKTFALGVVVGGLAAVATLAAVEGSGVTATDTAVVAGGAVAVLAWARPTG